MQKPTESYLKKLLSANMFLNVFTNLCVPFHPKPVVSTVIRCVRFSPPIKAYRASTKAEDRFADATNSNESINFPLPPGLFSSSEKEMGVPRLDETRWRSWGRPMSARPLSQLHGKLQLRRKTPEEKDSQATQPPPEGCQGFESRMESVRLLSAQDNLEMKYLN